MVAAFSAKSHGQMSLSNSLWSNQGKVGTGIKRGQGRQVFQLIGLFAMESSEIKGVESLWLLQWQPAQFQQGTHNVFLLGILQLDEQILDTLQTVGRYLVFFAKAAISSAEKSSFRNFAAAAIML